MAVSEDSRFPPRLHVIVARDGGSAIVIRRGPSNQVATFRWDTQTDEFELGQWLKGRIYELQCDLSIDGNYFIYFAADFSSAGEGSWTAVSRTPYLKALDFYSKGDTWYGGGLFISEEEYWLNHGEWSRRPPSPHDSPFRYTDSFESPLGGGPGGLDVYFPRLIRDGWTHQQTEELDIEHNVTTFQKRAESNWVLTKLVHSQSSSDSPVGKGLYWEEHRLEDTKTGKTFMGPSWEWADIVGDRLAWAQDGALYYSELITSQLAEPTLLHDFAPYDFIAVEAPY